MDKVLPWAYSAATGAGIKDPIFAFDNASIHKDALAHPEWIGLTKADILELPTYSPDFNKAIEHNHAIIEHAFSNVFRNLPSEIKVDAVELRIWLHRTFWAYTDQESVNADVRSLRDTWKAVIAQDGDYPDKQFM